LLSELGRLPALGYTKYESIYKKIYKKTKSKIRKILKT
jgi:hypothetical protein